MNFQESLKWICPKSVFLQRISGRAEITPEDLLHAMGRIQDPIGSDLLRLKFALMGDIKKVYDHIEKITNNGPLVQLALAEYLSDHRCPTCNGTSELMRERLQHAVGEMVFCEPCGDTGRIYPTDKDRAQFIGVHVRFWPRLENNFKEIQGLISSIELDALRDIYNALEGLDNP